MIQNQNNLDGKFVQNISNIFEKTEQFIKSGGLRKLFLEQFKKKFDEIESDVENFLSYKQTLKYLVEQLERNTDEVSEVSEYLDVLLASHFKSYSNPKSHNSFLISLNQGSDHPIDLRELRLFLTLALFELSYNLEDDKFNLNYLNTSDLNSLVTTVSTLQFSKLTSCTFEPTFYLLNLLKYLTTETGTDEFHEIEEKLFDKLEENLLENLEKTLNVFKANLAKKSIYSQIHCEYQKGLQKKISIPLELFKTKKQIEFLEEEFILQLARIQQQNHENYWDDMKISNLKEVYQNLLKGDLAQYYLKILNDSNYSQLINPQFVRFFKLLHSSVTVTEDTYPEVVADVKKFLYEEESPYKTIQPFISQLSILDVLDEEDLVSILSYFIKDFEGVFVTSIYNERDSVFVKEINLRDISLPSILTNNSNDIDEHIIVSGEDVKEIFKHLKRLNLKEGDFSFYLNPYSRNSFANKIAMGNIDSEFEDEIFTHLKQLQKLVQTYSSTKNLNQMYIGDDSSVKTVTIENVKFFRKLFSEISVDKYLVESDELVDILQEFYFIPKDKIQVEEERPSHLYSILRPKRVELKEFVSDLLNHSSETN